MEKMQSKEDFDFEKFEADRAAILAPLVSPETSRREIFTSNLRNLVVGLALGSLLMSFFAYLSTGEYIVPWLIFLVLGGAVASTILLKDDPETFDFVDDLRDEHRELYREFNAGIESELEGRA